MGAQSSLRCLKEQEVPACGHLRKVFKVRCRSRPRSMKMSLLHVSWMGNVCPLWRPEPSSAHKHSGSSLAAGSTPDWTDKGFGSPAWAWAGSDILLILTAHTSSTGRAHKSPTAALASAAATRPGTASLACSISAGSKHLCAGTWVILWISPLSLIRAEMSNLYANIYTFAFKCRHFSLHSESWPWCFLFSIFLHCNRNYHWACY